MHSQFDHNLPYHFPELEDGGFFAEHAIFSHDYTKAQTSGCNMTVLS
jgi:hypothetical protein